MWHGWWLLLLAILALIIVIFGLIWLVIEFPGLVKWKEVPKESAEGRARWDFCCFLLQERPLMMFHLQARKVEERLSDSVRVAEERTEGDERRPARHRSRRSACCQKWSQGAEVLFDQDEEVSDPSLDVQQQLRGELRGLKAAVAQARRGPPCQVLYQRTSTRKGPPCQVLYQGW